MATNIHKEYAMPDRRLTLDEMKTFLWGAATRLRGQIDAAGYKEYIFPLLFFKRISDVYDEQFDGYVAEGGEEYANSQAEDFAIRIPAGAHWRDVRSVTENVGQRLVEAFIAIEQANPGVHADGRVVGGLEGIFGPKDIWTNKAKMPDHIISSLIEDFSRYTLSIAACPADEMGQAYEYLVGKFADDAGNTAQEFYTNRTVVTLMAEILKPQPGESIYDPTCGSGGMLVKCLDYLREKGQAWQSVKVFGQEINALTSAIARMNLYLNGVEDFSIVREDTLKNPAFVDGSHLRTFDVVLANPPYSIKNWDRDAFTNDKWGRNFLGTPPQGRADYAFLQHIIASMNPDTGRCAILFPHGVLFRKEEREMREALIKSDKIESVIGLGPNLFYNSPMEACIIICNNAKPENRKGKVLMINALKEVTRKNGESYLEDGHLSKILSAMCNDELVEGFSALVDNDEICSRNADLTISLYAFEASQDFVLDTHSSSKDWEKTHTKAINSLCNLANCIGIDVSHPNMSAISQISKEGYVKVKLGDVAIEIKETWKGDRTDVPVVGLEHLNPEDIFLYEWDLNPQDNTFTKKFSKGQVLLGRRRAYQKKAIVADFEGICSGDITTIDVIPAQENRIALISSLLPFVIQNDKFFEFAVQGSAGSLSPRVKWEHLKDYEFEIPATIEGQNILANKLWAAYRLKEAYKRLLVATDEMVKSQFFGMFGNYPSVNRWKDILTITNGKKYPDKYLESGQFPICGSAGVMYYGDRVMCDSDTIIIGRKGTINSPLYMNVPYWIVDTAFSISVDTRFLHPVYFYYWCKQFDFTKLNKQAVLPSLTKSDLEDILMPLPPLTLQNQFADIVRQADKSKFDGFKSQFFGMFGNYPSVNRWKDILTITNGKKYPDKYLESGQFPICGSAGVMYYGDRVMCDSDTIIIGRKGTINSPLYMNVPYWIVDTAFSISVDTRFLHPVYFYYWCKQFDFTKLNKQAVLPSLTKSDLEDILMPLPPLTLQNQFADIVRQADKSKYYENNKIKNICHILMNPIPLRKCS